MLNTNYLKIIFDIYLYEQDLVSSNLQGCICHETQPTNS